MSRIAPRRTLIPSTPIQRPTSHGRPAVSGVRLKTFALAAWLSGALAATALGSGAIAQATFNDNTAGALAPQQGGTGFASTNSWTASVGSGITVTSGDLAAPAYVTTGYTLTQTGTGQQAYSSGSSAVISRALANGGLTNSTLWFSFLARVDSGGRAGIEIDDPQNTAYNRILVRTGGASATGIQVYIDPGTSVDLPGTFSLVGSNVLVVGRLTLKTGGANETVDVWVNPNVTSSAVYGAPVGGGQAVSSTINWDTSSTGATAAGVQYMGVVAYSGGHVDNVIFCDMPTAYAQVTGYQPPAVANNWGGFVNGNWDSTTTNWGYGSNFTYTASNISSVTFADTNSFGTSIVNSNITVQASGVSIPTVSFMDNSINYLFQNASGNTGITGTTAISKAGTGTVTFAGGNTYTGGTTLSAGVLSVNSIADSGTSAISTSGTFTLTGGTLQYTGAGAAATTRTISGVAGTTSTIDLPAGSLTLSQITSGGNFTVVKTSGGTLTLAGASDDSYFQATVNGGTVVLSKTSSGGVHALGGSSETVNTNGTLQLAGTGGDQISDGASVTVNNGGVFDLGGQTETIGSLTLNGTGINGCGALTNSGSSASTLTVSGGSATLAGSTTVAGAGDITINSAVKGSGSIVLTKAGGDRLTLMGTTDDSSLVATVNAGTLVLAKSSSSTVHALGGNTDTVNSGGTIQLGGSGGDQIYFQNAVALNAGGALDFNGQSEGFDGLTGAGLVTNSAAGTNSALTLGQNNSSGSPVFSGVIADGNGGVAVVKTGTGTQTLSGFNTYSLGTTISNGTLFVTGQTAPNSGTGAGGVTIAGGTLGGNGRVAGAVSVASTAGAAVYPDSSGTLTIGGNLTFLGSSAAAEFNLGSSASGANDKVALENQTLTCNGATLTINSAGTLDANDYVLFDAGASGVISGSFNATPVFVGTTPKYAAGYSIVTSGTQVRLHYSPIPITVTAAANTKPYDGTGSAVAAPTVSTGSLATGDTGSFTELYADKNAGTGKTLIPAGTIKDTGNNNVTARYNITFANAPAGTITPANLTISASANTKTYDGTTSAAAAPAITSGSIQNGDTPAFTESYDTQNAGTGKTLTPAGMVIDGNSGNNYLYTFVPAANGTISQAGIVLAVASTASPTGYRDLVAFTATAQSDATGTIQFQTNSILFDTESLNSGSATSVTTTNLPRGTNLITAIYSGDGNYLPATNTFNQVLTNHPPVASTMTVYETAGLTLKIALSDLATNWTDADGDTVELTGVNSLTTHGATVLFLNLATNSDGSYEITNTAYLGYLDSSNVNDQMAYTISDGQGGTNTGLVNIVINPFTTGRMSGAMAVSNGVANLTFWGIPNYSYVFERATNLAPAAWVDLSTNQAATNGVINIIDNFNDLGTNPPASAYYRLKWQP